MYLVIKMYGDMEPWWFLDGWEADIVSSKEFTDYELALNDYQKEWDVLSEQFSHHESKQDTMVAFWDTDDQYWCDECDEYLQRYHSLLLIESKEVLPAGLRGSHGGRRLRPCQLKN